MQQPMQAPGLYPDLGQAAVELLQELVRIPSLSGEEDRTAILLFNWLEKQGVPAQRHLNNVYAVNSGFDAKKPTLLLVSHHDTVKPAAGYTVDPFCGTIESGKLTGLGSNDAGASLVCMMAAFKYFFTRHLPYNLIVAAAADEERSGLNGLTALLGELPVIDAAIVGEPTQLELAIAEKGLMVIDAEAHGVSGHAARNEGVNAISIALEDIQHLRDHPFTEISPWLGPVKISVNVISGGTQHNVVPDRCRYVIDVRSNELYTHEEILEGLKKLLKSEVQARSVRLRATAIPEDHPLVKAGKKLGKNCYGSPTLSDKALLPCPALKMGPGDSARSHTADEFIYLHEIDDGIATYIALLEQLKTTFTHETLGKKYQHSA